MITQHAQDPGSTAGFFFSKKQNEERKNEREKGGGDKFSRECPGFGSGQMGC